MLEDNGGDYNAINKMVVFTEIVQNIPLMLKSVKKKRNTKIKKYKDGQTEQLFDTSLEIDSRVTVSMSLTIQ